MPPPPPPSLDHGVCDRSERSEEAGAEAEAEAGSMQKTSFPTEKGGLDREREGGSEDIERRGRSDVQQWRGREEEICIGCPNVLHFR